MAGSEPDHTRLFPNSVTVDIAEVRRSAEEERLRQIEELKPLAKELHELVIGERFRVDDVTMESYDNDPPYQRIAMPEIAAGRRRIHRTGFTSATFLEVLPHERDVPVKRLVFEGYSSANRGDYILARIPRYEEKVVKGVNGHITDISFYVDRPFREEECAIEVAIFSANGDILRRERSVDFRKFAEPETERPYR